MRSTWMPVRVTQWRRAAFPCFRAAALLRSRAASSAPVPEQSVDGLRRGRERSRVRRCRPRALQAREGHLDLTAFFVRDSSPLARKAARNLTDSSATALVILSPRCAEHLPHLLGRSGLRPAVLDSEASPATLDDFAQDPIQVLLRLLVARSA